MANNVPRHNFPPSHFSGLGLGTPSAVEHQFPTAIPLSLVSNRYGFID